MLVADYAKGPKADEKIVEQAAAELARRGQVRFQNNGDYDPGMPGHQLDIFEPDGKQLRASVYMAQHRLTITQAEAAPNDLDALQFEQSIVLIDHAGAYTPVMEAWAKAADGTTSARSNAKKCFISCSSRTLPA